MKNNYNIAVIPGDGVGPEVIREGLKILTAISEKTELKFTAKTYDFGGEKFLNTKEILPDWAILEFKQMDAIYLGAVGHPDVAPGILEKELLLKIRFELDQYINLRPVKLYPNVWTPLKDKGPDDIDFVVIRENTEDVYTGVGGFFKKNTKDEVAIQEMIATRKGVERCVRYAFEYTKGRNIKNKLTLCDKSNVLTYAHNLWQRVFWEVGESYPEIKKDHAYVDALCMWLIKNPETFDVIVTCNMFGDIITDLGAVLQGGMGVAASGNINPEGVSMFEPIHGSAPKYAGKNVINPLAAICACQMMLSYLGEIEAANLIEESVVKSLAEGHIKDLSTNSGLKTNEIGDLIVSFIKRL